MSVHSQMQCRGSVGALRRCSVSAGVRQGIRRGNHRTIRSYSLWHALPRRRRAQAEDTPDFEELTPEQMELRLATSPIDAVGVGTRRPCARVATSLLFLSVVAGPPRWWIRWFPGHGMGAAALEDVADDRRDSLRTYQCERVSGRSTPFSRRPAFRRFVPAPCSEVCLREPLPQ